MKDEIEILKKIRHQIAHCMSAYGDDPEELMHKLEQLVIEWYEKGIDTNKAINITCPYCHNKLTVYHMDWSAITCLHCQAQINQPYGLACVQK